MAWGAIAGRSSELAGALGGVAVCLYPPGEARRPPVLVRYAVSALRTTALLWRWRGAVVVTNPPIIPGLLAYVWSRLTGGVVALDSHPSGFGAKQNRASAVLLPVHRWLARRVTVNLVAAPAWQHTVESWGGQAMVVHEAPATSPVKPSRPASPAGCRASLRVLYVGTFAADEPVAEVVGAAAAVPSCEMSVTGSITKAPEGLVAQAPANVHFVGFLAPAEYRAALGRADVVVALTTEPSSVMRAAYEAVYAGRPLVVSDWPELRRVFPAAVHSANTAAGLAAALHYAAEHLDELAGAAHGARATQLARWESQRAELTVRLGRSRLEAPRVRASAG